jgi:starch phosphorylase
MNRYSGLPPLPERINRLDELAVDLWWSWNREARRVFRRLDYTLWRATAHNPVRMLWVIPRPKLEAAANDPEFLRVYDRSIAMLDDARAARKTWWTNHFPHLGGQSIAYFSAEFALHQSLPIYAGGLGVLAGDHCKEAGDLGVPLIGVGFMYPQGYFHQHVSAEGWQEESYERLNWADAAIEPALTPDGKPCVTAVPLGDRTVLVAVWRVRIGRVELYLLDTSLEENAPWDRELSARLYGGDRETRVQQEIILGIGGVRALKALGSDPAVFHLNEGHAAFVVLQRIRDLIERGESFDHALEEIRQTTIFTTHTPVPAGHDAFPFHLVEKHLAGCWGTLGAYRDRFLALGSYDDGGGAQFNMTALALRSAGAVNAVSKVHGEVTREMWAGMWPGVPHAERPVTSVTNGVHVPTWMASDMADLFNAHLGADWLERHDDPALWDGVLAIPDEELWAVRQALRRYLFAFVR